MRSKMEKFLKAVVALTIILTTISTVSFAAWWGTPGYEWARANGLATMVNTSKLNNVVSLDDLYSTLLKYLAFKGAVPKSGVKQNIAKYGSKNGVLSDVVGKINAEIEKESLTISEYRVFATYLEHAKKLISDNADLLTRDNLKDLGLYLSLAKYRGAMKINDRDYRTLVVSNLSPTAMTNVGSVKYTGLYKYNIKPYYESITRKEFLVLIFSLFSDQGIETDTIIERYNSDGVLIGYDNDLMLDEKMTYAEMYTFLKRFETFEFNSVEETEDGELAEDEVVEYK